MIKSKKIIALTLGMGVIIGGMSVNYANNLLVDVTAQLNYEMAMMSNGQVYAPIDESNQALRPLVYENQVYLPEKIIEDVAKLNIDYDGSTKQLWIGDKQQFTYFQSEDLDLRELYFTASPKELYINGKIYNTGVKANPDSTAHSTYIINISSAIKNANKVGGSIYVDKSVKVDSVPVRISKGNKEVLGYVYVTPGEVEQFEVETRDAEKLIIEVSPSDSDYELLENLSLLDLYYK